MQNLRSPNPVDLVLTDIRVWLWYSRQWTDTVIFSHILSNPLPFSSAVPKSFASKLKKSIKTSFLSCLQPPLFLGTQEHREVKEVTKIHISISTQQPWTLPTTFVSCVPVTFLYSSSVFLHTFPPVLIHHSKQLPTSPVPGVSLMHIGVKEVLFSAPRIQRVQTWEPPPPAKQTHILHQHLPVLAKKTGSLGANGHYFRN